MKKMSNFTKILAGVLLGSVVTASVIPGNATGTPAVSVPTIQSTGTFVYNDSSNEVRLYSSDLMSINGSLNDLAIYAKDNVDRLDGEMDALEIAISDGKNSVAEEMNDHGANISLTSVPTFDQLVAGVTDVYNAGITYADGRVNTSSASYTAGSSNPSFTTQTRYANWPSGNASGPYYSRTYSFSFSHRVLGVISMDGWMDIRSISISGNTVTINGHAYSDDSDGANRSITAIGY